MEIKYKNQHLYVLKTSTIRHTDIQVLPVSMLNNTLYINLSFLSVRGGSEVKGILRLRVLMMEKVRKWLRKKPKK